MNIKLFCFTLFICLTSISYAQQTKNQYLPKNIDSLKIYLKKINDAQISRIDGPYASKIKKAYENRDEDVYELIEDSIYLFNDKISKDLNLILKNIYSSNPEIDSKNFGFFIKNSIVPNAGCYGDGMFELNLGLFTQLDSNDELAYIICHEIAHQILNHSLKELSRNHTLLNSKETKEKVKKIEEKKYGQARAALSVIDELNIDILDHSKETEAQADSLGYVFFSKTIYKKPAALCALEKLKKDDEMIFHHDVKIDSVFNFKTYPFKSYWLNEAVTLFSSKEEINDFSLASDTLKSHPEIEFRVSKLTKEFNIQRSDSDSKTFQPLYKDLYELTQMQSIETTIDLRRLDQTLYQLIQKFETKKISADYYYTKMAQVLKSLYIHKEKHELGKYVPQKNAFSDEKQLNKIRLLLHNLELGELKKIGLAFCETNNASFNNTSEYIDVYNFFKIINN